MTTPRIQPPGPLPSVRRLLTTVVVAAAVAAGILVTAVLPAEYGVDPLGVGRALGLTAIGAPPADPDIPAPAGAAALTPVQEGPVAHYGAEYKVDSIQLVLGPYEYLEYKYRLEKGASMVYAWTASALPVYDFHADPDGTPKPDPVSFDRQPRRQANGAFTAPFSGIHGWYWENTEGDTMTITLTTAGFYSAATEFRSNRTRRTHNLTALPTLRAAWDRIRDSPATAP